MVDDSDIRQASDQRASDANRCRCAGIESLVSEDDQVLFAFYQQDLSTNRDVIIRLRLA